MRNPRLGKRVKLVSDARPDPRQREDGVTSHAPPHPPQPHARHRHSLELVTATPVTCVEWHQTRGIALLSILLIRGIDRSQLQNTIKPQATLR